MRAVSATAGNYPLVKCLPNSTLFPSNKAAPCSCRHVYAGCIEAQIQSVQNQEFVFKAGKRLVLHQFVVLACLPRKSKFAIQKSSNMNALELKGSLIEMIAKVDDQKLLRHLHEVVAEILAETWSDDYELTPEQEAVIEADYKASFNREKWIDHEVVMQKMSRWLKP